MNVKKMTAAMTGMTLLMILSMTVAAQDRLFTYTYQSNVLGSGQKELEVWNTFRTGRDDFYARLDHRTEFEVGLGSNIQTAFYLNLTTMTMAAGPDSAMHLETENEIGFSNEWKFKLLDPVADPLGLALYAEVGIGSSEFEMEGKLILDKKIGNLTVAVNGVYELEMKPGYKDNALAWENESKAEADLGLAWSFSPKFHLALESSYRNVFGDGELLHSALYAGPGMSFVQKNFWLNFTVLPQVVSLKGESGSSLNLIEYEKIQFRLLFSFGL
jgi:hypothetical protein